MQSLRRRGRRGGAPGRRGPRHPALGRPAQRGHRAAVPRAGHLVRRAAVARVLAGRPLRLPRHPEHAQRRRAAPLRLAAPGAGVRRRVRRGGRRSPAPADPQRHAGVLPTRVPHRRPRPAHRGPGRTAPGRRLEPEPPQPPLRPRVRARRPDHRSEHRRRPRRDDAGAPAVRGPLRLPRHPRDDVVLPAGRLPPSPTRSASGCAPPRSTGRTRRPGTGRRTPSRR